ncbi:MAG: serine--tRNA ligase [Candidatus Fermentibacteraceae bacterium]
MIDRMILRNDPERVRKAVAAKKCVCLIDEWLSMDERLRVVSSEADGLRALRNSLSLRVSALKKAGQPADDAMEESRAVGEKIAVLERDSKTLETGMSEIQLSIPNIPDPDVPLGGEDANQEIRRWGEPPSFDFTPRPHWELMKGVYEPEAAGEIAGSNFILFRGWAARLQRKLINWMLDNHHSAGMEEVWPPFLASRESVTATGQLPKLEEDMYRLERDDLFLIPTGEVPITNLYRGAMLPGSALPVKLCGYTPCFRREAGSYGKETRGLNRVHQFEKVEMVWLTHPDESRNAHEAMLAHAAGLLEHLGLHYRVLLLASGDLSFSAARCYDLEIWSPGQEKWLEVSSVSNFHDFQARRGNIRFKPDGGGKPLFVHTLNGSGLALPRLISTLVETFQRADGTVDVEGLLSRLVIPEKSGPAE